MIDINFVSPTGGLVKSVNGKTGNVVLTALDIKGVATEDYVSAKIAEAQLAEGGEVDLTAYATKDYVDKAVADIDIPEVEVDLTNYYTKEETDNAITNAIDGLEEIDLTIYATKEYVDKAIEDIGILEEVDLTNYYTKGEVDLLIPDVSGYTTMSAVEGKGYQTAEQVNALIADALADIEIGGNAPSAEGVEF